MGKVYIAPLLVTWKDNTKYYLFPLRIVVLELGLDFGSHFKKWFCLYLGLRPESLVQLY
jgi:hypothetical protein